MAQAESMTQDKRLVKISNVFPAGGPGSQPLHTGLDISSREHEAQEIHLFVLVGGGGGRGTESITPKRTGLPKTC